MGNNRPADRRKKEVLLTTLVDLLVQGLFVLIISFQIASLSFGKDDDFAKQTREILARIGVPLEQLEHRWQRLIDPDQLDDEHKKRLDEIQKLSNLERQNQELRKELETTKLEGSKREARYRALGDPPCWVNDKGQVEYIFHALVMDDGIRMTPAWPSTKFIEVEALLSKEFRKTRTYAINEFERAFASLLERSKREKCRYYVKLTVAPLLSQKGNKNRDLV